MAIRRNATNSVSSKGGDLSQEEVIHVDPKILRPHPENHFSMDDDEFDDLVNDISELGLIHWPTVREVDDGGYQILSGHRRVKACLRLAKKDPEKWATIPVRVLRNIPDDLAFMIVVSGNNQRGVSRQERIDAIEKSREYIEQVRIDNPDWKGVSTDEILTDMLGYSSVTAFKRKKKILLDLNDYLYELFESGVLTEKRADSIARKDKVYQQELADFLKSKKLRTRDEVADFLDQYDKGVSEHLKESRRFLGLADNALFRARDLIKSGSKVVTSDYYRMIDMRNILDKMIKASRGEE